MPFFQNPFQNDFTGVWVLSDRQYSINFKVAGNVNALGALQAYNRPPYNVSVNKNLTINFSPNAGVSWTPITIDVSTTAANTSAALPQEIVSALNTSGNNLFKQYFTALVDFDGQGNEYVQIKTTSNRSRLLYYVSNGNAESVLRFNKKAGVAELPTYFQRHAVPKKSAGAITLATNATPIQITSAGHMLFTGNVVVVSGVTANAAANGTWSITVVDINNFTLDGSMGSGVGTNGNWVWYSSPDANHTLIELDPINIPTDATIVSEAGFDPTVVHADWQLLKGRSGLFTFQNITVDGSDRITQIIEFPAGAVVGDFGRLIKYVYSGTNTHPSKITEQPRLLTSADLVVP